jgi:hypothetical protein
MVIILRGAKASRGSSLVAAPISLMGPKIELCGDVSRLKLVGFHWMLHQMNE